MNVEMLQSFLGWTALINYLLLIIWFVLYRYFADAIYLLHNRWFDLSRETFTAMHYAGMAALKILTFVFFLAPYLALYLFSG